MSDAFVVLGTLAGERGDDSSGVALFTGRPVRDPAPVPSDVPDLSVDGCRIVKGRAPFSGVWSPELLPLLDHAPVALGHTRRAVQGSAHEPANAGPLAVNGLLGIHGEGFEPGADGEAVFRALAGRHAPAEIAEVLEALVGRGALVWVDRARPDRVRLARAALSPLVVAVDAEHNLYWASDPRWFREVRRATRVRPVSAVMLREGTYLEITRDPEPQITARTSFRPRRARLRAGL
ncbi:hypothetical protein [Thermomonospora umbrina]|uniref:hypothetical protein n=1 Tax=Thermomonospora umbrina TaxID=111806 RepID=UPI0011C17343|nr:hypothetical protein [Thermomonospora umbrina]